MEDMDCTNCGNRINNDDKFYPNCGTLITTNRSLENTANELNGQEESSKKRDIIWKTTGNVKIVYSLADLITCRSILGFKTPSKGSLSGDWYYKRGKLTRGRIRKQTINLDQTIRKIQILSEEEKEVTAILNSQVATPLKLTTHMHSPILGSIVDRNEQKRLLQKKFLRIFTDDSTFEMYVTDEIFTELVTNCTLLGIVEQAQ